MRLRGGRTENALRSADHGPMGAPSSGIIIAQLSDIAENIHVIGRQRGSIARVGPCCQCEYKIEALVLIVTTHAASIDVVLLERFERGVCEGRPVEWRERRSWERVAGAAVEVGPGSCCRPLRHYQLVVFQGRAWPKGRYR